MRRHRKTLTYLLTYLLSLQITMGRETSPKIYSYFGGEGPRLIHGSLGPPVDNQNHVSVGSSVSAGLEVATNTHTNHTGKCCKNGRTNQDALLAADTHTQTTSATIGAI